MHPNETKIREVLTALGSGDASTLAKHLSPDIVFRLLGSEFVTKDVKSGAYRGLAELAAFSAKVSEHARDYEMTGTPRATANDDLGASITRASYVDTEGNPHDAEEVWVWHFEDGKVVEIWDYNRIAHLQMIELGERGETGY